MISRKLLTRTARCAAAVSAAAVTVLWTKSANAGVDAWSVTPASANFTGVNWTVGSIVAGAPTGTIASGDTLYFDGSTITTLNNDEPAFTFAGLNFNSDAAAYTINGNSFTLTGAVNNFGGSAQVLNTPIALGGTQIVNANGTSGGITFGGVVSGSGSGLTKNGLGTLFLSAANTYTGPTTINGGAVNLTGSLVNSNSLILGGGTLNYAPVSAGTQSFTGGTTISPGGSTLSVTAGSTLALGTITRSTGGTAVFNVATGTTSGTATLTNGVLPWGVTFTAGTAANSTAAGYNFATIGTAIAPYTAATAVTTGFYTNGAATVNYDVSSTGTPGLVGTSRSANTVRFTNTAAFLQQTNSTQTETFNALIAAGAGSVTLGGGSVMNITPSTTTNELVLGALAGNVVINGPIVNNASGAIALTVFGAGSNSVTLGANSNFGGNVYVDSGTLNANAGGSMGNAALAGRSVFIGSGATLAFTAGNVFGNSATTVTPTLVINQGGTLQGGTATSGIFNAISNVTLNGGTILTGGGINAVIENLAFVPGSTVTVGGTVPSTIGVVAGSANNSINLGTAAPAVNSQITFNVGDVTGDANPDLIVSAPLANALNSSNIAVATGFNKTGNGTMLLTGASTYTGPTTITVGTLQLGDGTTGRDGTISGTSGVANGSVLVYNRFGSNAAPYPITGSGTVVKLGPGTQTLSGPNAYTGPTNIAAGTLAFSTTTSSVGAVNVSAGATLRAQEINPGTTTLTTTGITFGPGTSNLVFDFNSMSNPTNGLISTTGAVTLSGSVSVSVAGILNLISTSNNTSLPLMTYSSQAGTGAFTLPMAASGHTTYSLNDTATALYLNVSSIVNVWKGTVNGTWDINTTKNWSAPDQVYLDGDITQFDDSASNYNITIAQTVSPASVTFANGNHTYTIGGSPIAGATGLALTGSGGTVVLNNINTYAGATSIVSGATLQLGDGTTGHDGTISNTSGVADAGTLVFNRIGANSAAYPIAGQGNVTVTGPGNQTLSGTNSYVGTTTITGGGTLIVATNANLGSINVGDSPITIDNGTLSTTAGITDTHAITINSGGATININSTGAAGTGQLFLPTVNLLMGNGPLILTGNGMLTTTGAGNLRVGAGNVYAGNVTINAGGEFEYGVNNAVNAAATFNVGNNGELITNTGTNMPNVITVNGGTNSVLSFENGNAGNFNGGSISLNANAIIGLRDWYNPATVRSGTINDPISGVGGIQTSSGTATTGNPFLTLLNTETYTGVTVIGINTTLQLGNGVFDGFIDTTSGVTDNGTLLFNRSTSSTFGVVISGTGALIKTGANTLTLTGNNTYGGATNVVGGSTLIVSTIGATNSASSNLGVPINAASGTIFLTGSGGSGQLTYIGVGETTDRPIVLSGGTAGSGSAIIDQSGTGNLNFSTGGIISNGIAHTLTLQGSTAGTGEIDGVIANGGSVISVIKQGTGTWTLGGVNTYTGSTNVASGKLIFGAATVPGIAIRNLSGGITVSTGASLKLAAPTASANRILLVTPSLSIAGATDNWTAQVDITSNDLDLPGADIAVITNQVKNGLAVAGGGQGITSTTALASSTHLTSIGVVSNSQLALSTFDGQTVGAADVLVKYTFFGDANLDGKVDGSDYTRIDNGYNGNRTSPGSLTGWYNGDFNYDNTIDGSDYTLIDNAFNRQTGPVAGVSPSTLLASPAALIAGTAAVPEPASITLIAVAGLALVRRRR